MLRVYIILIACLALACAKKEIKPTGTWRAVVEMQGQELPFTFDVMQDGGRYTALVHNAEEVLLLDEVSVVGDTLVMVMHIFDSQIRAKIEGETMNGWFVKNYAPEATLPFTAEKNKNYRYATTQKATTNLSGKYTVTFTTEKDTIPAVGIFNQVDNNVTGTFLTPTGDYRYLQGNVIGNQLLLSTFDGNHAFVFNALLQGDTLSGDFYSGKTSHEKWVGVKDSSAALPNAESLTYLKKGFDKIEFSFPDVNGNKISLEDEKYAGKVTILQIFGTWCPNCMDETRFLTTWYDQNKNRGVEIIGLAYERKDDFAYASERVKKMKNKFAVHYDFVIAGTNDKAKASETLPMLNKVIAFPTTIFVGKDGKVKRIHTGFTGPGTGLYYEQFKESFNRTINELLAENITTQK
jgi:thiol-disulfide isomerase/thioredoxin